MPQFLTRKGTSSQLEQVIGNAERRLVLISPYLKISHDLVSRLQLAERRGVEIHLVYRAGHLKEEEQVKLDSLKKLCLYSLDHLHAKCYANEQHVLITSMNLYDHSEANNWEVGVLLSESDRTAYSDARKEIDAIMHAATPQSKPRGVRAFFANAFQRAAAPPAKPSSTPPAPRSTVAPSPSPARGFCIRCTNPLQYRPQSPLCGSCYSSWSRWGNENYAENVCHRCGDDADVSKGRPLCLPCFREAPFSTPSP